MASPRQLQGQVCQHLPGELRTAMVQFLVPGSASLDAATAEEGCWWRARPLAVGLLTLGPKCAAAPGQPPPLLTVGLLDRIWRGHLQGGTRAISDSGLEHWREERRVSE